MSLPLLVFVLNYHLFRVNYMQQLDQLGCFLGLCFCLPHIERCPDASTRSLHVTQLDPASRVQSSFAQNSRLVNIKQVAGVLPSRIQMSKHWDAVNLPSVRRKDSTMLEKGLLYPELLCWRLASGSVGSNVGVAVTLRNVKSKTNF